MHVLFLHQNFPAQFGQVAVYLAQRLKYRCTFVSEKELADSPEIKQIQYQKTGGARAENHYCSRTFENQIWHSHSVYQTLKSRPDIQPDLIVAHTGFVSSLFLRELYPNTPQINYFEFFYHAHGSDMDFRHDLPFPPELDFLRLRARNAHLLLDLHNCDAGYSPTEFQRAQLPLEYQPKIRTIFDGIDHRFWQPVANPHRTFNGVNVPQGCKLLTYVSRGFEAARGFDIFLQIADRICRERSDTMVLVVGEDRIAYGGDERFTGGKTFKEWAIEKYQPNLSRIHFVGRLPPSKLAQLLALSDLHLYFTVPFVLSWSLLNALSCGALVLASDTPPVREVVRDAINGRLVDFFDIDRFTQLGLSMLADPAAFRPLRTAAREVVEERYSLEVCLPKMVALYESVLSGS